MQEGTLLGITGLVFTVLNLDVLVFATSFPFMVVLGATLGPVLLEFEVPTAQDNRGVNAGVCVYCLGLMFLSLELQAFRSWMLVPYLICLIHRATNVLQVYKNQHPPKQTDDNDSTSTADSPTNKKKHI